MKTYNEFILEKRKNGEFIFEGNLFKKITKPKEVHLDWDKYPDLLNEWDIAKRFGANVTDESISEENVLKLLNFININLDDDKHKMEHKFYTLHIKNKNISIGVVCRFVGLTSVLKVIENFYIKPIINKIKETYFVDCNYQIMNKNEEGNITFYISIDNISDIQIENPSKEISKMQQDFDIFDD